MHNKTNKKIEFYESIMNCLLLLISSILTNVSTAHSIGSEFIAISEIKKTIKINCR